MTRYITFIFLELLAICFSATAQTKTCNVKIIKLKFDTIQQVKPIEVTDSLLAIATLTTTILADNSDIVKFEIKIDTVCCSYVGQMYVTSHRYLLTSKSASQLSALNIPLCCGIPAAVYVDGKEVYRAMLWNVLSSFGNKSVTITLVKDTLIVTNRLPRAPDFNNGILTDKSLLPECLLDKQILTKK